MSECCGPSQPCCGGGTPPDYEYGPEPFLDGEVDTFAGPVPRVRTALGSADAAGSLRMRLGVGRDDYRIRPRLYAVGDPDDASPVLVTCNYKLTFDVVRETLSGLSVWLLVLDTRGINVWCAAGKGTFGTEELVRSVRAARLEQIVSHTRLVLPQLGATGVAAHEVRAQTGFAVTWGPVRIADLPAFLDEGMKATPEMRRVSFPLGERAKLIGVELGILWRWQTLAAIAAFVGLAVAVSLVAPQVLAPALLGVLSVVLGVVAGAVMVPLLLPWLPGRAFSLKGAIAGVLLVAPLLMATVGSRPAPLWAWGALALGSAVSSYVGMNFTGSSTYTSPSGVEWEMRRAIPLQLVGAIGGVGLVVAGAVVR